jgi:hypothetical protein
MTDPVTVSSGYLGHHDVDIRVVDNKLVLVILPVDESYEPEESVGKNESPEYKLNEKDTSVGVK